MYIYGSEASSEVKICLTIIDLSPSLALSLFFFLQGATEIAIASYRRNASSSLSQLSGDGQMDACRGLYIAS